MVSELLPMVMCDRDVCVVLCHAQQKAKMICNSNRQRLFLCFFLSFDFFFMLLFTFFTIVMLWKQHNMNVWINLLKDRGAVVFSTELTIFIPLETSCLPVSLIDDHSQIMVQHLLCCVLILAMFCTATVNWQTCSIKADRNTVTKQ